MNTTELDNQLQANTRQYEQQLRALEDQLSQAGAATLALRERLAGVAQRLAAVQLESPEHLGQAVTSLLQEREYQRQAFKRQLQALEDQIAQGLEQSAALAGQIDDALAEAARAEAQDPAVASHEAAVAAASAAFEAQSADHEQIRVECREKLPAFAVDPLYRYLVASAYGTAQYRGNRLVRWLDGIAARQLDFTANRRREMELIALEFANQRRFDKLLSARDEAAAALERLREGYLEQTQVHALRERQQDGDVRVDQAKRDATAIQAQLSAYVQMQDPQARQAQDVLAKALGSTSIAELLEQVRRTPDTRDDVLAGELLETQRELGSAEAREQQLREQIAAARQQFDWAKDLERNLRAELGSRGNAQPRSGQSLGDLVGALAAQELARTVRNHRPRSSGSSWSTGRSSRSSASSDSGGSRPSGGSSFTTTDSF